MVNERSPVNRPPTPDTQTALGATGQAGLQAAADAAHERLNEVLDGRQAFHQAQGMLAEMTGCTLRRSGEVLLHVGGQLGLQTAASVAGLFLINAADALGDPDSAAVIRRFTTAAALPSLDHDRSSHGPGVPLLDMDEQLATERPTNAFATLVADGRALEVRGELDMATTPLLAAAFAGRQTRQPRGSGFLLELQGMTFVDVSGVRALSDIDSTITDVGDRLEVNPPLSAGANRMLRLAVSLGWIAPVFTSHDPSPDWAAG
jgi:hypothetical protein